MHVITRKPVEPADAREQATEREANNDKPASIWRRRLPFGLACCLIFAVALGVRLLYWQDNQVQIWQDQGWFSALLKPYLLEAERTLDDGGILFPNAPVDPSDARMIVHPPGYSLLIAALYGKKRPDNPYTKLRRIQVLCDAAASLVVFLIAEELLPVAVAIIAAVLVAISPHFAYNSLRLSPDTLAVLPVLVAIYFVIRAIKRESIVGMIVAGALIGLSCWFRANALLLAPWLAIAMAVLIKRGKRWRYSLALVGAVVIVIAPITIRNWVVYHEFIPVSLPAGINLIQGIAEYDREGRFGMPLQDRDTRYQEVNIYNRPDYGEELWVPDGIARERERTRRGMAVIRSNPGWYLKAMIHRAGFMMSYNDSKPRDWPFNTAQAPSLLAEPAFGHILKPAGEMPEVWSSLPTELLSSGTILSQDAEVTIDAESGALRIKGDSTEFGNQFATAPIAVREKTDYVLTLAAKPESGSTGVSIMTTDLRIGLASADILTRRQAKERRDIETGRTPKQGVKEGPRSVSITLPFASGNRNEVRIVVSNNGTAGGHPIAALGQASLFDYGATRYLWSRYPRAIIRWSEENLFTTGHMLPLVVIGIALLIMRKQWRVLLIILAVPVYYIGTHAGFSVEYRYILAIHYFFFITGAVTIYNIGRMTGGAFTRILILGSKLPNARQWTRMKDKA